MNSRTGHGNRYLRRVLLQAAWAASHMQGTYLRAVFFRVKARRGWGKAIMAVAHKLLIAIYQMLRDRVLYQELAGITSTKSILREQLDDWWRAWNDWEYRSCLAPKMDLVMGITDPSSEAARAQRTLYPESPGKFTLSARSLRLRAPR